jgi:hypothetical protein
MTVSAPSARVTPAARRVGYVVAVGVNIVLLVAVNVWPGWDVAPFLTGEIELVLPVVNAVIAAQIVANSVYLVSDPTWLKSLGDIVTLGVGALALVRIWQVFPFDLGSTTLDWALVVRIVLVIGIIGSCVGMLVALATFVRT